MKKQKTKPDAQYLWARYSILSKEWHPTKNGELSLFDIPYNSNTNVWWRCEKGHEWEASVKSRIKGDSCPRCAKELKSLATTHPEIAKQWHPTKNDDLTPADFTYGSAKKVWWQCENGHEWFASIASRTSGHGCPTCSRQTPTHKSIAATHPDIAAQWHPTKNGDLSPSDVTHTSTKKVWWQCEAGHEWEAQVKGRARGSQCPYCPRKPKKEKSLALMRPDLAAQWHPTKNGDLTPFDVVRSAEIRVWWMCDQGHEWMARIDKRCLGKSKCPDCFPRSNSKRHNNLSITHPDLAAEWHPTKNGDLTPLSVTHTSPLRVWWQCEEGHEWEACVVSRSNGFNCPYCSDQKVTKGVDDLATVNAFHAAQWHPTKNGDLKPSDVHYKSRLKVWWLCDNGHEWESSVATRTGGGGCPCCPGKGVIANKNDLATTHPDIAAQWHPTKNGDMKPTNVTHGSIKKVWWQCENGHEWEASVLHRTRGTGCPHCPRKIRPRRSLALAYPDIAAQWHPTKNGDLTPFDVTCGLIKKVWWVCEEGHEWEANIANRVNGTGCPHCRRKPQLHNSFASTHPELAAQWHPTKNGKLTPYDVTRSSDEKVWWRCKEGHEWEARVSNRAEGAGCPHCPRKIEYKKSIAITHPEIALEWHPTKNGFLKPFEVSHGTLKKVWWQCKRGHEWVSSVSSRTHGSQCPQCPKKIDPSKSFAGVHPELISQWHPTKNDGLTPFHVSSSSGRKVWWQCEKGHEWAAIVASRSKGTGCPHCYREQRKKISI